MAHIRYSLEIEEPFGLLPSRRQLGLGSHRLGRDSHCEVVIDARGVSREHLRIEILDRGCVLHDLGSTNGSRVEGEPLTSRAIVGDCLLQIGSVRLRLREHSPLAGALAVNLPSPTALPPLERVDEVPATRAADLLEQLRSGLWDSLPQARHAFATAASCVLDAWLKTLGADGLQLRGCDGAVLAQAGRCLELEAWIDCGELCLWAPAGLGPRHPQAEALLRALGRWLPEPETPTATPLAPGPLVNLEGVASRHEGLIRQTEALRRLARRRISVLLLGETGVGKEVYARFVHAASERASGPFVAINCAALPRDLLEAELFGIEKGAATGVDARAGVFERAHGGTLFLDELGDMPSDTQVRLLRALEDGRIHRVGGSRLIEVDVRFVGATHRDLKIEVEAGRFRMDLYHRLAGFAASIPPLRERRMDIAPLAVHFFQRALREYGLHSPGISNGALQALEAWHWPGNVRELRQTIDSACALLLSGEALDLMHLPAQLRPSETSAEAREAWSGPGADTLDGAVAAAEREALRRALTACGGNHEDAWTRLGIGKTSFYKKLKQHGLGRVDDAQTES